MVGTRHAAEAVLRAVSGTGGIHSEYCQKMAQAALQCGWLAAGCGCGSGIFIGVQSRILEKVSEGGQGGQPGCTDPGGALRQRQQLAAGRPVGYADEL